MLIINTLNENPYTFLMQHFMPFQMSAVSINILATYILPIYKNISNSYILPFIPLNYTIISLPLYTLYYFVTNKHYKY